MLVKQGDIFWGLSRECIQDLMQLSSKETFEPGTVLFKEGDPADRFYSLIKGRVRLHIGTVGQTVYIVSHAGEAFGWSGLTGNAAYTASAQVQEPTSLLWLPIQGFRGILADYPQDAHVFYRHLARTLGNRLLQSYAIIAQVATADQAKTHGTGQIQEEVAL
jgi:CRP-like cAMP-binding protein